MNEQTLMTSLAQPSPSEGVYRPALDPRAPGNRAKPRAATTSGRTAASRSVLLFASLIVATALVTSIYLIGASPAVVPSASPSPTERPTSNGLIAYDDGKDVWVVNPDGTRARRLELGGPDSYRYAPSWSPDGRRLAYLTPGAGIERYDLDLVDSSADTGSLGLATAVGTAYARTPAAWSPDGSHLVFGDDTLYVVPSRSPADTNLPASTRPPQFSTPGDSPSWSPDGSRIAFVANDGLLVANADLSQPHVIIPSATVPTAGGNAVWSPTADVIAFEKDQHIWLTDPLGVGPRDITPRSGPESFSVDPAWASDGSRIAFLTCVGGVYDCHLVTASDDGSDPTELSAVALTGIGGPLAWSPDGRLIAAWAPLEVPGQTNSATLVVLDPSDPNNPVRFRVDVPGHGGWSKAGASWQAVTDPTEAP